MNSIIEAKYYPCPGRLITVQFHLTEKNTSGFFLKHKIQSIALFLKRMRSLTLQITDPVINFKELINRSQTL